MTPHDDDPVFDDDCVGTPDKSNESVSTAAFMEVQSHFAASPKTMAPINDVVTRASLAYLRRLDPENPPAPGVLERELLATVNSVIRTENQKAASATEKFALLRTLTEWQVAQVLLRLDHVIRIAPSSKDTDREYDLLAMYQSTGPGRGLYTTSEDDIRTRARRYNTQLTLKEFAEVLAILKEDSPRRTQCSRRDLLAVANGVLNYSPGPIDFDEAGTHFHFEGKELLAFHPSLVFLAKCHVEYVEDAPAQFIHNDEDDTDWEVRNWIDDLFHKDEPDPADVSEEAAEIRRFNERNAGLSDLVWEILGAIIRPHVSWDKSAWFYSESGNNGKGTLCALMRNLCGPRSHTAIQLADFGKDFALEPLVRATAIIVDENDVGTFVDKAANLKAVVTGDVIQINRKYRMPIAYQFHGFMVQCLNEFPRIKDKSDSFYRRQLFVPFEKSFTGHERKYIKSDYLQRREVLEYVLWYVVNRAGAADPGDYYELSEPDATRLVLEEYKTTNDPVRAFWADMREELVWDFVPFVFLYDLYKAWFASMNPSGSPVSHKGFVNDLMAILAKDPAWFCPDKSRLVRRKNAMDAPEPLIADYELKSWTTPGYTGTDRLKKSMPVLKDRYRGISRRQKAITAQNPTPTTDHDKDD